MSATIIEQIETGMNDERIAEQQTLARRIRETKELLAHLQKRHAAIGGALVIDDDEPPKAHRCAVGNVDEDDDGILTPAEIRQLLITDENRQPPGDDAGGSQLLDVDPDEQDPERFDGLS